MQWFIAWWRDAENRLIQAVTREKTEQRARAKIEQALSVKTEGARNMRGYDLTHYKANKVHYILVK